MEVARGKTVFRDNEGKGGRWWHCERDERWRHQWVRREIEAMMGKTGGGGSVGKKGGGGRKGKDGRWRQ